MSEDMPEKIPDELIIKDLVRIKGENESYIEELEDKIKQLEKPESEIVKNLKKQIAGQDKRIRKLKQEKNDLIHELAQLRRSRHDNQL